VKDPFREEIKIRLRVTGKSKATSEQFKEIFDLYYPEVRRRAAYLLGNSQTAEDMTQEAFLKLYQTPPREEGNLAGWLNSVVTNLAYNYLRGERNRAKRECSHCLREINISQQLSTEENFLQREEVCLVHDALRQLPPRERFCLLLKYSGATYSEIAAATGIKPGSIGAVLARARARFKKEYLRLQEGI
jgi:RNA polymerase sigma factor (sigma-70 family)